ncbi:UDP-N-acetylmuramoyl-L-alanyl-D-glutamate--2,6-diaminopimelate ligase [Nocardioides sp. ChNu-99]|uniref:UDP-N-acetylmuramoyl-L-alanyl-D-glutamate--2, 6-diaminopimelate ligase n=1 Tax=Nocardioides sp. ChNu-99 TaxID=2839897 RepID=UPI0024058159|nr:UDP-N-acetylmuramoyl-L-alanyl-D-glutamate--2,6-diaminopimelate ligase [Nocardioides sp. ChNu-99]MDF9716552.1 UDP-N-acetylmuramoyl-L-alanyl-D-glutamate--2,6-diaminopimelate ligase [Nocardioides sp. ChNu-99]
MTSTPPTTPPSADDAVAAARPRTIAPVALADVAALVGAPAPTADRTLTGVTLSSRRVLPGDLYVALPGARAHGADFAADAVAAGAVAVLTDADGAARVRSAVPLDSATPEVPVLVVDAPRSVLGRVAAHVYGEPAARMATVAVTGTQGKTTTTRLAEAALTAAGVPAAVVGTVGTRVRGTDVATALTTPEAPDLHGLFARMVEADVEVCAMEVSSHALVLGRVDGVVFDVAVFTNLGRDHLDFHADVEEYFAAKASLFTPERARRALVNVDDEHGRRLVDLARAAGLEVRTFSVRAPGPGSDGVDWWVEDVVALAEGSRFTVRGPGGVRVETAVALPGGFNVANALAALAALVEAGQDPERVAAGLAASGGVPGRLERVDAGQPFTLVVDYAHKPDAIEAALGTLRPLTTGRLVLVLGAGGDRDTGKRPVMGRLGAELADVLVVTDDNPRTEDPAAIRAAVLAGALAAASGAGASAEVLEVGDRRAAIRAAVRLAAPGDIVVVAGKGHETGQEVDGTVHPFDDRVVAAQEVAALLAGGPADDAPQEPQR